MKKQEITRSALKALASITEREVKKNISKGPTYCLGFFHQPKRPEKKY